MQLVSRERFPGYPRQLPMTDRYNNGPAQTPALVHSTVSG